MTDLFDAIFAYYLMMLGAGAVAGVRSSLRSATPAGAPALAGASDGAPDPASGAPGAGRSPAPAASATRAALGARLYAAGQRAARAAVSAGRHPRTASIAGWASGARFYRGSRRGMRVVTARVIARRVLAPQAPAAPMQPQPAGSDPAAPGSAAPVPPAGAPGPGPTPPQAPGPTPNAPPPPGPPSGDDLLYIWQGVFENPDPAPAAPARPVLFLVPQLKEYPSMSEIHDYESAQSFTGEASATAAMEAEDAVSAAESTAAAAEFSSQTAARVDVEIQTIEAGIATMTVLGVDENSLAAYHQFLEGGLAYRELAATFAAGLADLTGLAAAMSAAAVAYHELGANALETITAEQGLHDEAAKATGHGGADGSFFGVASTTGIAAPAPAPALAAAAPAPPAN
jgi:hypothetical protein